MLHVCGNISAFNLKSRRIIFHVLTARYIRVEFINNWKLIYFSILQYCMCAIYVVRVRILLTIYKRTATHRYVHCARVELYKQTYALVRIISVRFAIVLRMFHTRRYPVIVFIVYEIKSNRIIRRHFYFWLRNVGIVFNFQQRLLRFNEISFICILGTYNSHCDCTSSKC